MRFLKTLVTAATIVGTLMVGGNAVSAARTDASAFAADCNDDGRVDVAGVLRVVGGTGALTTSCIVALDPGATLVLREIDLTGADFVVTTGFPSGANTTVKVIDSMIQVSGDLQLSPGAVAGDADVPDQEATVVVRRSTLRAADIDLSASLDWAGGRVVVADSDLIVPIGSGNVAIEASILGGTNGVSRVVNSTISTGGNVVISTGTDGRTAVRDNSVSAAGVTISTGPGGVCRTSGNAPALACS